ncbi:hypothetical protein COCVIDRAFT_11827 [Bipolaris victoriae FI3]|uniref:Uncharacterized protein n=1 Tax=Bipolaris victoriae (strain FI3) TaxID=930091 RepID=W7F241_BIPV3|nr:hypothetical protein COCVIDRAFT_11827 [Bipolaris victoriae FI3]
MLGNRTSAHAIKRSACALSWITRRVSPAGSAQPAKRVSLPCACAREPGVSKIVACVWFAVLKQAAALVVVANTMHAADQQAVRGSGSNKLYPYHDIATPTRKRLVFPGKWSSGQHIWYSRVIAASPTQQAAVQESQASRDGRDDENVRLSDLLALALAPSGGAKAGTEASRVAALVRRSMAPVSLSRSDRP